MKHINKYVSIRSLLISAVIMLAAASLAITVSPVKAAGPSQTPGNGQVSPGGTTADTETTCAVEKVGWIICPVTEGAAKLGDNLFKFLADNFLQTEPELLSNEEGNGTVTAWEIARNLANVMFIIAFLIIIYSQVTGAGLSNYGLKRMLPRLIIAAIAVNVSYYICQGMVDISNILGYEIKKALTDIANQVSDQHVLASTSQGTNATAGDIPDGALATLAIAILAVAAVWIFLGLLGPIITLVVITCIVIIIILLLRKAIIVLLVVASPIAFVMYLLPNTEKYFNKWLNMFWQLLMVFPIVALLFGGGQLASSIILAAGMKGSDSYKVEGEGCVNLKQVATNQSSSSGGSGGGQQASANDTQCTSGGPGWMLALVAAGIAVAPLLAVWSVLKGALAAAGAIGGKIAGAVQKGTGSGVGFIGGKIGKGVGAGKDAAKKYAGESAQAAWQRSQAKGLSGQGNGLDTLAGNYARRRARRAERLSLSKSGFERAQREAMDRELTGTTQERDAITKGMGTSAQERAVRGAQSNIDKIQAEELQAASITSRSQSDQELRAVIDNASAQNVNDPKVAAAVQELAQRQDFQGLEKAIDKFGNSGVGLVTRTMGSSISQNNPGFFTAGNLGALSRGAAGTGPDATYRGMAAKNIAEGAFSAEKMAETGPSALKEASFIAGQAGNGSHAKLTEAANELLSDARLVGKLSRNRNLVGDMSVGTIVRNNRE